MDIKEVVPIIVIIGNIVIFLFFLKKLNTERDSIFTLLPVWLYIAHIVTNNTTGSTGNPDLTTLKYYLVQCYFDKLA